MQCEGLAITRYKQTLQNGALLVGNRPSYLNDLEQITHLLQVDNLLKDIISLEKWKKKRKKKRIKCDIIGSDRKRDYKAYGDLKGELSRRVARPRRRVELSADYLRRNFNFLPDDLMQKLLTQKIAARNKIIEDYFVAKYDQVPIPVRYLLGGGPPPAAAAAADSGTDSSNSVMRLNSSSGSSSSFVPFFIDFSSQPVNRAVPYPSLHPPSMSESSGSSLFPHRALQPARIMSLSDSSDSSLFAPRHVSPPCIM